MNRDNIGNALHAKIAADPTSMLAREFFEAVNQMVRMHKHPDATEGHKRLAAFHVVATVELLFEQ